MGILQRSVSGGWAPRSCRSPAARKVRPKKMRPERPQLLTSAPGPQASRACGEAVPAGEMRPQVSDVSREQCELRCTGRYAGQCLSDRLISDLRVQLKPRGSAQADRLRPGRKAQVRPASRPASSPDGCSISASGGSRRASFSISSSPPSSPRSNSRSGSGPGET
jgi:hypothetical protein